jgi:4'-phosphopantetheinyl transferase
MMTTSQADVPGRPATEATGSSTMGELGRRDIHLWWIHLESPSTNLAWTLSPDECLRASRFHFERDRQRWLVGRAALRTILGRYVGESPERLRFRYGPHGKPSLSPDHGGDPLRFNLSHSEGWAVLAIAVSAEVGVDLERIRPIPESRSIADLVFSQGERWALHALPAEQRTQAFIELWVSKESLLKGLGDGFVYPPGQLDIAMEGLTGPRVVSIGGDRARADGWSLHTFSRAGFAGALAIDSPDRRVTSIRRWE